MCRSRAAGSDWRSALGKVHTTATHCREAAQLDERGQRRTTSYADISCVCACRNGFCGVSLASRHSGETPESGDASMGNAASSWTLGFVEERFLADTILVVHFAFVLFVIGGFALILAGAIGGWGWIRNPTFRYTHLAAIVFVAIEAIVGVACPLDSLGRCFASRDSRGAHLHRAVGEPVALLRSAGLGFHRDLCPVRGRGGCDVMAHPAP